MFDRGDVCTAASMTALDDEIPGSLPRKAARLSFEDFHREWLAERIASAPGIAAARATRDLHPLTLRVAGGTGFTYSAPNGELSLTACDDGIVVIEIDRPSFREFADERLSAAALLYSGRVTVVRGAGHHFLRWEPYLRSLYHDRPILDWRQLDLRDRTGSPLDTSRVFALGDLGDDASHFMKTAGFLVVRGVFSGAEVVALRGECERARALMTADDPRAWWGRHRDGSAVCTRVNYAGDVSDSVQSLFEDRRLREVIAATGEPVRPATDRLDGATIIFKTPDMRAGLSDLPWHRDCGMGGHPVMCPLINASVHLAAVGPATGDLRAIAGSFAGCTGEIDATARETVGVSFTASAGDVTLHYGDILHAAPPPTDSGRRTGRITINLTHPHERCFRFIGPRQGYNDVLLASRNGVAGHDAVSD